MALDLTRVEVASGDCRGVHVNMVRARSERAVVEYSLHGYDMSRQQRHVYAFLTSDGARVKIGMVGHEDRLALRLVEVTKRSGEPGLSMVASVSVEDVNEHEIEDIEAAMRVWLTLAAGFSHAGRVDWLDVPDTHRVDWKGLLERAKAAVLAWRIDQESLRDAESHLVAEHCLAVLGDPSQWKAASGYTSLALCTMDAIWSMGIRYTRVVVPLIDRYRQHRGAHGADADADTLRDLLAAIEAAGGPEGFAGNVVRNHNLTSSRGGILKAEAVRDAAEAMTAIGITTVDDLLAATPDKIASAEQVWRRVRGQRSGISWDYFLMLTGREGVKSDRMIRRFVATALGRGGHENAVTAAEADRCVRGALAALQVDHPDLTLRGLDRTIWGYQSGSGNP